jgi:hypothetical protein
MIPFLFKQRFRNTKEEGEGKGGGDKHAHLGERRPPEILRYGGGAAAAAASMRVRAVAAAMHS